MLKTIRKGKSIDQLNDNDIEIYSKERIKKFQKLDNIKQKIKQKIKKLLETSTS